MGKASAKTAVLTVKDPTTARTVSTDCTNFQFNADANKIDVTGFGDASQNFIPGMPVYDLSCDFLYDNTATTGIWTVMQLIFLNATAIVVTLQPATSALTMTGNFIMENMPLSGKPNGAVTIGTVKFAVTGATAPTWA
jgi:hypothetical protein